MSGPVDWELGGWRFGLGGHCVSGLGCWAGVLSEIAFIEVITEEGGWLTAHGLVEEKRLRFQRSI